MFEDKMRICLEIKRIIIIFSFSSKEEAFLDSEHGQKCNISEKEIFLEINCSASGSGVIFEDDAGVFLEIK